MEQHVPTLGGRETMGVSVDPIHYTSPPHLSQNIVRDPRWGRNLETFGEDPVLISALGVEYARGLQVGDAPYIKVRRR